MDLNAKNQYLKALQERYFMAKSRKKKSSILDEYCRNTHQDRKHVIRKINSHNSSVPEKRIKKHIYDGYVKAALAKAWEIFYYPCGQRLEPMLKEQVNNLRNLREFVISDEVTEKLKRIAPATIDRELRHQKEVLHRNRKHHRGNNPLIYQEPHFSADGGPPFILDWETGKRRYSTSEDIARCARVADYLDHVNLVWTLGVASDVPSPMQDIVGMCTILRNSEKHYEGSALSAKEAQYEIEIAAAIVGGKKELKKRPIFSVNACSISPLMHEKGITEGAIELVRAGIPVVIYPMPMAGTTGPITLAGTMVVSNTEFLSGLVILEFASPGAPVVYAADVSTVDSKTGIGIESPEDSLMDLALHQLARYYDLPTEVEVSCSTSKLLDTQAGYQKAISLIPHTLAAPDIILGLGALEGARITSPEAMVIDNEIIDYALRFVKGLEVNDETLAVDVINKVGPGGIFLGEKHTLKHFRERWMPRLSDIYSFETWEKNGSKPIDKVAKEKVREILATHKPEPIPEDVEKEISQILKRAEAELLK